MKSVQQRLSALREAMKNMAWTRLSFLPPIHTFPNICPSIGRRAAIFRLYRFGRHFGGNRR